MDRASLRERIWYETSVPVFLERFVLPALATVLIGVILLNPFKFDWQQQTALAIVVVALAYFFGHTVHLHNQLGKSLVISPTAEQSTAQPPSPHISGPATTAGENSPAVTGDSNTVTYGGTDDKKLAPKDKQK